MDAEAEREPVPARWRAADLFAAFNLKCFLILAGLIGTRRYQGPANAGEFLVYGCVIVAIIVAAWLRLRKFSLPVHVLLLLQAGIVAHFAGAFVPVDRARLYDQAIFGIGYDNYVHGLNAFAAAACISHVMLAYDRAPALWHWLVLGLVLGMGAAVEIVEFATLQFVDGAGVGDYHNNARDLVADLIGALLYLPLVRVPRTG